MFKRSGEHRLTRIKSIYFYIKQNGPTQLKTLMDEFQVCERTIQRDLQALELNGLVGKSNSRSWIVTDKKVKQTKE